MKTCIAVINVNSRYGRKFAPRIEQALNKLPFKIIDCQRVQNTEELANILLKAVARKPDILVVAGGDGTIMTGMEAVVNSNVTLGIIPTGTANYISRNLHISQFPRKAVAQLAKAKPLSLPVGRANGRVFAMMCNIGIATEVSADVSNKLKRIFGMFAYLMVSVKHLFKHSSFDYVITTPSVEIHGRGHQISVFNADVNQHLKLLPSVKLHHNEMLLVVYQKSGTIIRGLQNLLKFMLLKERNRSQEMQTFTITEATITTNPKRSYSLDGEVVSNKPVKLELQTDALKVLCPRQPRD